MDNLFLNRRSVRKFKNIEVEEEKINRILEIALTAPSGRNKKPWDIIVINNKELINKIADARPEAISFLKNAPLAMVVVMDLESGTAIADGAIIASYIQLAAELEGLKTCWGHAFEKINLKGENVEEKIREVLNIPKNKNILCTIGIGYGDEDKKPHDLDKLPMDKVHFNKY
ncbi:MAG: nitroreductase family protein [Miniphocaeibacter sp.]|uniref:nitroreductase family protein n=1 Tax=Miniphocaeibacter sp. TaxID=3100973 RepID=UPI0017962708|nr:nitroreductase [Gallicola sp.]